MPRSKKPSARETAPAIVTAPASRPKPLAEIHPVLRAAARDIREAPKPLKGGESNVEGVIALMDALVRILIQRKLTVSAAWHEVTARQGEHSVGFRVAEHVKRAHKSKPSAFMPNIFDHDQEKRSNGFYYYKDGRKAGQPVYVFESTGVLSLSTSSHVPWGRNLTIQAVKWEPRPGETEHELVARVADDVPTIFDCMVRHREYLIERDRLKAEQKTRDAERAVRIEEARTVERRRRARLEQQDALVDRLMAQAAQARELRQYLVEAPAPRDGQEGYGRMLASVAARLAALERDLDPDAVEAIVSAKGLFPPPDREG